MTHGIHHITAISSNAKKCVEFYSKILGLRLVKKTVNQDDVSAYHLFFGDKTGSPGMDLTFFIFKPVMQGVRGVGQVTTISLAVPEEALDFWQQRFEKLEVKHESVVKQFGIKTITFYDFDDQKLELVGIASDTLNDEDDVWTTDEISKAHAIRYFDCATLSVASLGLIEPILEVMGYSLFDSHEMNHLYQLKGVDRAGFLQIDERPDMEQGINAAGTVHHIAFQVKDEAEELEMRKKLVEIGLYPTTVIDRFYFKSVYFRTPAGILFELATMGPGFGADENVEKLGERLSLPPFLEDQREEIERGLEPI